MDVEEIDITHSFSPIGERQAREGAASDNDDSEATHSLEQPVDDAERLLGRGLYNSRINSEDPIMDSDDDIITTQISTAQSTAKPKWSEATKGDAMELFKDLLDLDRPQLSQVVSDCIQRDTNLTTFLNFLVRPIDQKIHEGAGALGREAVDVAGARCQAEHLRASGQKTGFKLSPLGVHVFDDDNERLAKSMAAASSLATIGFGPLTEPGLESESESEDDHSHRVTSKPGPAMLEVTAMAQAISSGHAASFSAAIADTRLATTDVLRRWKHVLLKDGEADALAPAKAAAVTSPGKPALAASVRAVSVLYPRVAEEVHALNALVDELQGAVANEAGEDELEVLARRVTSLALADNSESAAAVDAVSAIIQLRQAVESEVTCAKRSFKLMRMLCGGSYLADGFLEARGEDITKAVFGIFSTRSKGNFHHACALIQRLIQFVPESFVKAIKTDSQRYIGSMLPYLHHAPVADALVQIVLLNHLASAQGGVGPNVSIGNNWSGNPFSFGLGGGRDQSTTYEGALNLYSQRGTSAASVRPVLWRSLSGWGFLSVLASHIYRPEYACVPDHITATADAFSQIVKVLAADEALHLLAPVGYLSSGIIRGFIAAACWPEAGIDYARGNEVSQTGDYDNGYFQDHTTPCRQTENMRILNELVTVAMQKTVPAAPNPAAASSAMGMMSMAAPPMVDNTLHVLCPQILPLVIAGLPAIAFALYRIHHVLHPDVNVIKAVKPVAAAPKDAHTAEVSALPPAAGAGAKKKKKKNKKKKPAASATAASVCSTPLGPTSDDEEEDEENNGEPTPSEADPSPARKAPERLAPKAADTASKQLVAQDLPFKHPGHSYVAPFGLFRLAASQLVSGLAQCTLSCHAPPSQYPVVDAHTSSGHISTLSSQLSTESGFTPAKASATEDADDESEDDEKAGKGSASKKRGKKDKKGKQKGGKQKSKAKSVNDHDPTEAQATVFAQNAALAVLTTPCMIMSKAQVAARISLYTDAASESPIENGRVLTYEPAEFWGTLVHWVVLYSHTNLFHGAFYSLLKTILRLNYEPALQYMLHTSKMVTLFIHHYEDMTPVPPPYRRTHEAHSPIASEEDIVPTRKARSSNGGSSARGTILNSLNALRLAVQSQPSTCFVSVHLRDHHSWHQFQQRLRTETEILLAPLIAPPPSRQAAELGGMGGFSSLSHLLSPNSYLSLLGGRNKDHGADAKSKSDVPDWDLGSAFAKQLGFDGVARHHDALVMPVPAAKKPAPTNAKSARPRSDSSSSASSSSSKGSGQQGAEDPAWTKTLENILAAGSLKVSKAAELNSIVDTDALTKAISNIDMLAVD